MKNGYQGCNDPGFNEHLKAIISASDACQVTISNPSNAWTTTVNVAQNSLTTVEIPFDQAYNEVSESVQNLGLSVSATDTISLVISNEATNSFDASFVLPNPVLADEYIVQNFTPAISSTACPGANRGCFVIIATQNNTIVDITPTKVTQAGRPANVSFPVTLNTGQTYFVYSQQGGTNGDLSGTKVKARDCKKIQVFNGNVLTTIPSNLDNGFDHIFEQAMPIAYWGKKFVLTSSLSRTGGDFVKITALENNTQIFKDGVLLATLNANATHEWVLPANPGIAYIEATNPCAINLYNTTSTYDNSYMGDPSMVWISPVEQQIKDILFSTFQADDGSITINAVNIVCPTSAVYSMQLNGNNIATEFQPVSGNPEYSYARITINQGTHRLRNSTGFVGHVYGFGSAKGYAYSIGSSMINLNRVMYIDDMASTEYGPNSYWCQPDTIHFRTNASNSDSVFWNMGDGSVFFRDSIIYKYNTAGTFEVINIIKLHGYNCLGHLYDTLRYNINIEPVDTVLYDTICFGQNYNRWGFRKDSVISDWHATDSATNVVRCGAATLHLKVAPVYHHFDTVALYADDFPFHYGPYIYDHPGTFLPLLHTHLGCDSLITLRLDLLVINNVDICETEYYDFYGTMLNSSGTYKIHFQSMECDTFVTLNLGIHPHKQTHFDDIACVGKPYRKHGFVLEPDSAGIYHYELPLHTVWGCDSLVTLTLQLPEVTVEIHSSNPNFCDTYETTLTAITPNNNIRWNTNETTPDITVTNPGTYTVIVTEQNCEIFDHFIIERCPTAIVFPSSITPANADGINDYFYLPAAAEVLELSIFIYDRWGGCVFSSTSPNFRWDGKIKGQFIQGVYSYVVTYRAFDKKSKMVSGVITVM
jgi:gliding motility-associated-like protein